MLGICRRRLNKWLTFFIKIAQALRCSLTIGENDWKMEIRYLVTVQKCPKTKLGHLVFHRFGYFILVFSKNMKCANFNYSNLVCHTTCGTSIILYSRFNIQIIWCDCPCSIWRYFFNFPNYVWVFIILCPGAISLCVSIQSTSNLGTIRYVGLLLWLFLQFSFVLANFFRIFRITKC